MTILQVTACLLAVATVLTACSKPAAGGATPAASGGPATASGAGVSDSEAPQQKIGKWETTISFSADGAPGRGGVTNVCIDAATLASGKQTAVDFAKANCSKNETRRDGDKWVTEMVCKSGAGTMTTHAVTLFASENAYHTQMTTSYDPPTAGRATTTTIVDGKWLGPCAPT